jgi:hypothetical protein
MSAHPLAAAVGVVLAVSLATVGSLVGLAAPAGERDTTVASQAAAGSVSSVKRVRQGAERPTTLRPRRTCDRVAHGFRPRAVTVPGVTRRSGIVTPPRDANGIPGVPPLTEAGKWLFAWDREQGVRPGDPAGNVLLNAHTWPDGSALGNRMLANLHRGDLFVVHGAKVRQCYRVTERVEVLAVRGLPRYYAMDGPPQVAIVVCSGRRLGPGMWEKRTVWFAAPSV